jgi:hypothetical protein
MADARTTFDEYVSSYTWATTNFAGSPVVWHAAAAAATHALTVGCSRETAAVAARDAAGDEATLYWTRAGYRSGQEYVEWFIWARANLRPPDERCHGAAQAALQVIAAGGSRRSATEAATGLRLPPAGARLPQPQLAGLPWDPCRR